MVWKWQSTICEILAAKMKHKKMWGRVVSWVKTVYIYKSQNRKKGPLFTSWLRIALYSTLSSCVSICGRDKGIYNIDNNRCELWNLGVLVICVQYRHYWILTWTNRMRVAIVHQRNVLSQVTAWVCYWNVPRTCTVWPWVKRRRNNW